MNALILWLAGTFLPRTVFGLNTAVLLGGAAKIKAVIDLLKLAGATAKEAKELAAVAVAKQPHLPADQIAKEAWENRGLESGQ